MGDIMKLTVGLIVAVICAVPLYAQEDKSDQSVFEGRILNRQGYPVANAAIDIYDVKSYSNIVPEATHAGQVKTNSEGRFSFSRYTEIFPQIEYTIAIIQADGYAKRWIRYNYTGKMDEVVLSERSSVLAGRVVGENGSPIEGAAVAAFFNRRLAVIGIEAFASTTDAQGQFEIAGLPLSEKAELYVQKEGYSDFCTIPIYKGWDEPQHAVGRQDIVLTLKEGTGSFQEPNLNRISMPSTPYIRPERSKKLSLESSPLSGVCQDLQGQPIANAKVYLLSDPNNVVESDGTGHFNLKPRLKECKRNVWWKYQVNKKRHETNPSWTALRLEQRFGAFYQDPDADWMGIDAYLIAESPNGDRVALYQFYSYGDVQKGHESLKLKLSPACHLKGKAVDADGQPLPGAVVEVLMSKSGFDDPDCVYTTTVTDEKGCFAVFPVAMKQNYSVVMTTDEGVCLVKQFSAGLAQHPYWQVEHFYSKEPGTIDMGVFLMDPKTYRVSGIVTNHLGRPISNALLKLNAPSQGLHYRRVQSDPNGLFVYEGLFAGPVDLECHVGNKGYIRTKTVAGDDDLRFIFSEGVPSEQLGRDLVPSAAVELTFIDEQTGQPVILPGAGIMVEPNNNSKFTVDLDDEGKARFLIAPGEFKVKLVGTGQVYKPYEKEIVAELYQAYEFQCPLKWTPTQKIVNEADTIVYPEIYSEKTDTWNIKPQKESDDFGYLKVQVVDNQTQEVLPDAEVLITFDKGTGRWLGHTNQDGMAFFAICNNIFDPRIASVSSPGYLISQPLKQVHADYRWPQVFTANLERKPVGTVVYPEIFSETENAWMSSSDEATADGYHVLEINVIALQSSLPVADAVVRLAFDKEKGRFVGTTDEQGKVYFAVSPDVDRCVLTSVTAPNCNERKFKRTIQTRYESDRKEIVEIEPQPVTINVQALDLQGNPAPKIWFYHEALVYDRLLKKTKWDRVFDHERSPTDENGQKAMKWFNETGPEPQVEHFICTYYLREHKGIIAEVVKAMPGSEITLQVKQPVQVQGRIVDEQGVGIPDLSFNFYYVINGCTTSGPSCGTKSDGSYGPVFLAPGFEYEIHKSRDRIGMFGERASVFIGPEEGIVSLPDCVLPD